MHVRFKNSLGWGETAHYRIAIDTNPPVSFPIFVKEGTSTDNPTPTISYVSRDSLSGLNHYEIKIGDGDSISTNLTNFVLPLQAPGRHIIRVKAVDNAGNETQSSLILEIIPIASPQIFPIGKDIFAGEGNLVISGSALPNIDVKVFIKNFFDQVVYQNVLKSDNKGNWSIIVDQPLKEESYKAEALSQDSRGALSLPSELEFYLRERPLFIFDGIEITETRLFVGILSLLIIGFFMGLVSYRLWELRVRGKAIITERDMINIFKSVDGNFNKIIGFYENGEMNEQKISEAKFYLNKIKGQLAKIKEYVLKSIEEIPD